MYIVGITGGIGSGKTTVAKLFEAYNIPVYYADIEAKKLMNSDSNIKNKLIAVFGNATYLDNQLNRVYLAKIVFNDKAKLAELNSIVHPEVRKHFLLWASSQNAPFVLKENAILYESGDAANCDSVIVVSAPKEVKIKRVMLRDNCNEEAVLARMNNQWTDAKKAQLADYTIINTELTETIKQVEKTYQKIKLKVK